MELSARQKLALEALKAAGKKIKKDFYQLKNKIEVLSSTTENSSTSTDLFAEKIILDKINKAFPTDTIISEERKTKETNSNYVWTVDPLDGTSNFSINIPYFGTCLSIQFRGKTQFSAIYDPLNDDLAFAIAKKGAFLNGTRIKLPKDSDEDKKLVGFYIQGYGIKKEKEGDIYKTLLCHSKRVISNWAPSIDWLKLLQGNVDFIVNYHTESEDFVPGAMIYAEAGGIVESFSQKPVILNLRKDRRVSAIAAHPKDIHRIRTIISNIDF